MKNDYKSTKAKKGWLIPYLLALDGMFFRRWEYWTLAVMTDTIPHKPIPPIAFKPPQAFSAQLVQKNLKQCLDAWEYRSSNALEVFIDWLLWGFNQGKSFPLIDYQTDDFWYRTFNLGLFYKEPADHFALVAAERNIGKAGGYFPTPGSVVELMVRMNFGDKPKHEHKRLSVCDPCSGSGIMLLYASNYSLNLTGMDINPLITKIALVNSYIYVPWLIYRPKGLTMFDKRSDIIEVELFTGIKVPKCLRCDNEKVFFMDVETNHMVVVNGSGLAVKTPTIATDLVNQHLSPENMSCATCHRKQTKEKL